MVRRDLFARSGRDIPFRQNSGMGTSALGHNDTPMCFSNNDPDLAWKRLVISDNFPCLTAQRKWNKLAWLWTALRESSAKKFKFLARAIFFSYIRTNRFAPSSGIRAVWLDRQG